MSVTIASAVAFFITSILILVCCLIPSMSWGRENEEGKGTVVFISQCIFYQRL